MVASCQRRKQEGRRISIVENHNQATTNEDCARLRFNVYYSDLLSVYISDSVMLTCSYKLYEFNKPN
jgi:hypothetical protein